MVVSQNGWFIGGNPITMNDLWVPLVQETPTWHQVNYRLCLQVTCCPVSPPCRPAFNRSLYVSPHVKDHNGLNCIMDLNCKEGILILSHFPLVCSAIADGPSQQSMWGADPSTCVSPDVCGTPQQVVHGDMRRYNNCGGFTPDMRDACNMVFRRAQLPRQQSGSNFECSVGLSLKFWRPWPPGRQAEALVPVPVGRGRLVSSWGKSCLMRSWEGNCAMTSCFYRQEWTEHHRRLECLGGIYLCCFWYTYNIHTHTHTDIYIYIFI